jgi:hypothetical protein
LTKGVGIRARPDSRAFVDSIDPAPVGCAEVIHGHPVPGLHKSSDPESGRHRGPGQ